MFLPVLAEFGLMVQATVRAKFSSDTATSLRGGLCHLGTIGLPCPLNNILGTEVTEENLLLAGYLQRFALQVTSSHLLRVSVSPWLND